jgi:hypothetical protein
MIRNIDDPARLNGATVIGGDGEKLGSVDAVYYDNATDKPEWVAVRSGVFGTRVTLVPLCRADLAGEELHVPFDKVQLRHAPHHDPGRELSSSDEADLYRYYGVGYTVQGGRPDDDAVMTDEMPVDRMHPRHRGAVDEADRGRLRRHVVTEHQAVTDPDAEVDHTDPGLRDRRSI